MITVYWFGFKFLLVPALVCAAEDEEKSMMKKMGYKLMAGMVLGMLAAFTLGGTVAIAQESHFSELWGRSGEQWTSLSRLPDFSFAGYRAGEQSIPSVKQSLNVRDFGARGDGKTDDTRAFKEAIVRYRGGAIFIPPGRYVISDILSITKSGVVLRGAGQGATTLYFARSLEDILGTGKVPYWGGLIDVSGENQGQQLTAITSQAMRGQTTLQVASAQGLRAGQWVRLRMTNPADNSLGSHLYADKGALNDERRRWYAGHIVDWAVRIRSVQGNTVTLERPLRLDVRRQWRPELWSHSPTVEEVGIEDLTIEFPPVEYRGHYNEAGYFAIQFTGVYNSWVRNLTIVDADIGVVIGAGGYNTVANVTLKAKARTGATTNGETGHYGFGIGGISQDNLVTHCTLQTTFVHNLSVGAFANGNVFSAITTRTGRFDHHGAAPYENLFTDILITEYARDLFLCGGNRADEPNAGARTTFWNIRSANNSFPRKFDTTRFPQINIVGIDAWPTRKTATDEWIESWPGQTTRPANLYEAQLAGGLASQDKSTRGSKPMASGRLPPRVERFTRIETVQVGDFAVELCCRDDGAFGLGNVRKGTLPLGRADFLVTWQVDGEFPVFERRSDLTVFLQQPPATLTFTPQKRECAGTTFDGFQMELKTSRGTIVETASWELGGSTEALSYFDGYRGWHAPPQWLQADAVPQTNPKLMPSLLAGTGFQFQYGQAGALLHFHTTLGDRLRNVSRGAALEFETTFNGPTAITRYIFTATGDSRINLWSRACELVQAELGRKLGLPEPVREIFLQWPPFSRRGFRETARQCAAVTADEGFTGASIDVIWDNADFNSGAKNMNVWDYTVCEGYGSEAGLKYLVEECRRQNLHVIAWVPAGHLWSQSPVWKAHPDWILLNARSEKFVNPAGGIWHGALDSSFHNYWRDRVVDVVQKFGLDGLWLDTHLSYAQQLRPPDHSARLGAVYGDFIKAGARHLLVEGDASAFGSYAIAVGDDWEKEWGKMPEPDLYYGAMLMAGSMVPRFYLEHFRRWTAAGAPWVIDWDFLYSSKLKGEPIEAARREIRQVVQDYRRVKDRMVHRFVHKDGTGYTWTNDQDDSNVIWLLKDAALPDGRQGKAGKLYVIQPDR